MSIKTRGQTMAQSAFAQVERRRDDPTTDKDEYRSFAREFPTLVHQCGLAQAVAFAQAKKKQQAAYADDLAKVLVAVGHEGRDDLPKLAVASRDLPLAEYLRLSRDAIEAAVWIKRYVEALFPEKKS